MKGWSLLSRLTQHFTKDSLIFNLYYQNLF